MPAARRMVVTFCSRKFGWPSSTISTARCADHLGHGQPVRNVRLEIDGFAAQPLEFVDKIFLFSSPGRASRQDEPGLELPRQVSRRAF